MAVIVQDFGNMAIDLGEAVKKGPLGREWPVYTDCEVDVDEESGETFVVARVSLFESVADQDNTYRGREPEDAAAINYPPLRDSKFVVDNNYALPRIPELVVELANSADDAITPEVVVDWAETYGLLAPSVENVLLDGLPGFMFRESVSGFAEAAVEVRTCLRIYEALHRDELDLEKLSSEVGPLPGKAKKAMRPEERKHGHERAWLFGMLGRMVQMQLREHCYPQFNIYTRGTYPTGRFALSWGFHNLLGAIWLQMAWMLEDESSVRFCRLPDCRRVIPFELGEPSYETSKPGRGTYSTRSDRVYCKYRPCKQKYWYRKKRGWSGYD